MAANAPRSRARVQNFTRPDGVALKEHLETVIAAEHEFVMAKLLSVKEAGELSAQRQDDQIDRIKADISDLKRSRDQSAGKASQTSVIISMLFGVAGIVFGFVNLIMH
jgi:hypothetical protein